MQCSINNTKINALESLLKNCVNEIADMQNDHRVVEDNKSLLRKGQEEERENVE